MADPKRYLKVAGHTYKVWLAAPLDRLKAVEGVRVVVAYEAGVYMVTLDSRYDPIRVLDAIARVTRSEDE